MSDTVAELSLEPAHRALPEADASLASRIRVGDVHAFKAMFDLYYDPLHAYAVALLQDQDAAEECVQDVIYHVWALGPGWELHGSIGSYLFTAVRNRAMNHVRRHRVVNRWKAAATSGAEPTGMGKGPEPTDEACRRHEITAAARAALERLPERRRVALTLRGEYRMTNPQIAAAMGISVKNVERYIMLALKALRTELNGFF
jgi:RNA polymerase sigma-70 factor (ECF subfamily)